MKKVIYWELWKKLEFLHSNKWYVLKLEALRKYETHKILWDLEINSDQPILTRRLHLVLITPLPPKKTNLSSSGFCCSKVKAKEGEKGDKYLHKLICHWYQS